ncbi:ATP-binding protein [Maribacter confluentis]|uniref:histidine kinase n=1 Tax=Maribacter confluentis TaxID=1656093 RepID=A0ABT8RN58_9FLAO|nr:ATP-binding protein [Maribacter confluentis]MDO1511887.1 ATP-binding protein [Maribacter confluentis]
MLKSNKSIISSLDWIAQIPSSIAIIDTDLKLKSASPKWLSTFNFCLEKIKDQQILDLFPQLGPEFQTRLSYSLDGLRDIKFKHSPILQTDTQQNSFWHLNPWKDGYGNIIGVIIKVETISKAQELQWELNKTKRLLDEKSSIAQIGSWEYDIKENNLQWTPAVYKIYGVTNEFIPTIEKAIHFYLPETSRKTIKDSLKNAIQSGLPWNEKLKLKQKDGTVIWVNSIGRPKFKDGKCTRIIGTIQNITDTILANSTTPTVEPAKYPLFEKVPFGLAIIDWSSGQIKDVNNRLLQLTEFEKTHFLQRRFTEFIKKTQQTDFGMLSKQLSDSGEFSAFKTTFTTKNNKNITIQIYGTVLQGDIDDNILCTIENISSQTNLERNFKKTIRLSKEKNEKLLNFAHMVSHNLKTHATNFSLLLNFLNAENGVHERKKLMNMLFSASDNLTETIKGLREIVEIRSNINLEKKSLSLNEHVFLVEQNVAGLLKETKGKIVNEIADTVTIKSLPAYLNSILTNCITNAIKYRKEGKSPIIIISAKEEKNYTVLSIEDNGIGIDLEKHGDKLFGLYNTFHRNMDSRGIGLYITKNQIEAMNGKITAMSTVGQGTTFKIYFNKN